jgi:hypothetical protein
MSSEHRIAHGCDGESGADTDPVAEVRLRPNVSHFFGSALALATALEMCSGYGTEGIVPMVGAALAEAAEWVRAQAAELDQMTTTVAAAQSVQMAVWLRDREIARLRAIIASFLSRNAADLCAAGRSSSIDGITRVSASGPGPTSSPDGEHPVSKACARAARQFGRITEGTAPA